VAAEISPLSPGRLTYHAGADPGAWGRPGGILVAGLADDVLPDRAPAAWRIPMVDLAAEYADAGAAVEAAALRVLRSGRYLLGPETEALEAELARMIGVRQAVGVGSGTQALMLSLRACIQYLSLSPALLTSR